jgi:hypothetical protein
MDEKGIVIGRDVPDLFQPSALGKNRRFIKTDEKQARFPWRRLSSHAGARCFLPPRPVQFDVRIIGLEFGRECFEFDHRRVINRSDGHSFLLGQNMGSSK